MRYFFLLLLIVASVAIFIAMVIPRYDAIQVQRTQIEAYNTNLATAKQLQQSRDALIAQYNNISTADLNNIETLLPDSVDNIRLIIQIDSLATKDGLASLRNVDYSADQIPTTTTNADGTTTTTDTTDTDTSTDPAQANLPYGTFTMSFETSGPYSSFLSFLSDLQENLRLVDVTDITFTPNTATTGVAALASGIQYKVTIQTYWLKQ